MVCYYEICSFAAIYIWETLINSIVDLTAHAVIQKNQMRGIRPLPEWWFNQRPLS